MPASLCIVGSLNMDFVCRAPRLPEPGETLLGGPLEVFPGGKGANQAVAAARLSAPREVAMIGCVGDDEAGRRLRGVLEAEGVDLEHVAVREQAASGVALITVVEDGENTIVVAPGANRTLTGSDVEGARETISGARWLIGQLEVPLEILTRAFELARELGAQTLLNAAPAGELPPELYAATDLLVVNEVEARLLLRGGTAVSPGAQVHDLAQLGPRRVVLTLGARGAVAWDGESIVECPAHEVQAVDATGAGDAFVGALARALVDGLEFEPALRYACAAGALAATRGGALPSLPRRDELESFLQAADVVEAP